MTDKKESWADAVEKEEKEIAQKLGKVEIATTEECTFMHELNTWFCEIN